MSTTPIWAVIALLYIATAIVYHLRYRDRIEAEVTAPFFFVGLALVVLLNRRIVYVGEPWVLTAEIVAIVAFLFGWYSGVLSLRSYVRQCSKDEKREKKDCR